MCCFNTFGAIVRAPLSENSPKTGGWLLSFMGLVALLICEEPNQRATIRLEGQAAPLNDASITAFSPQLTIGNGPERLRLARPKWICGEPNPLSLKLLPFHRLWRATADRIYTAGPRIAENRRSCQKKNPWLKIIKKKRPRLSCCLQDRQASRQSIFF